MAMEQRGLILVTGTTGSGKSSTLAAMIDHINTNSTGHILTIEDPIEFLHRDKKCLVNQREIGVDAPGFSEAIRSALRQDPDVILVGEMRDFETIQTALLAAETGHLVMSTLHTLDTTETINRIVSVFPPYQQKQVRLQLASVLRGIVSQRLIPRADGKGRVPAVEVCVATATVRESIVDSDKTRKLPDVIAAGGSQYGMQTFDQSLMTLYNRALITYEEALRWCSNPDDFALRVRGVESTGDSTWGASMMQEEGQKSGPGNTRFWSEVTRVGRTKPGSIGEPPDRPDPWGVALKQLALRARTVEEVRRFLARRGYAGDEIATVLARLRALRYLDDADFARIWVAARARRTATGPARLARELRAKGVANTDIGAALSALAEEWDVSEAAAEAVRRKLPSLRGVPPGVARRRLAAFLERRGFSTEIILALCRAQFRGAEDSSDG
jgi:SOS response regulatory protein OraA/RecX